MCGVIAVMGKDASRLARVGLEKMKHRGIRSKFFDGRGVSIGHVRLPIVGLGEGNDQPVKRGEWTMAFVGEILDFRERFPGSICDVDVVADAWSKYGPEGFIEFDGFWSVVAHDEENDELFGMVDYLSQKPLYFRDDGSVRAFASEPDAVACLAPIDLDQTYLSAVMKWGYCPETWRTPYEGIRRLRPGEYININLEGAMSGGRIDVLKPKGLSPENLKKEIEYAVERRVLSSDVPVACLVSGGLDSAITYTLAKRHADIRAYHVENGEREECMRVAPNALAINLADVPLPLGLRYHQEPIDLGSLLPQVALSMTINKFGGERVCLTGDGADELFGGYGRSARYDSQASDVWHELVAWHLPRLDRVMMRNQIEVRSPFLARKVAAAALALPREARTDKRIIRDLFHADLPFGVADLPKKALRTSEVEVDRESHSRELVELFIKKHEERVYATDR